MKRVLVLGGDGMLGHQLLKSLKPHFDVKVTLHRPVPAYAEFGLFNETNSVGNVDARDFGTVERALETVRPDVIVNAIGIVKQRAESSDAIPSIEVNSLLPHRLSVWSQRNRSRLIHFSTDCVFNGSTGDYSEGDSPDAEDLYGRSKLLGEVDGAGCVTIRSSIIGLELSRKKSLIEWFLSQKGEVRGFSYAIFSGLTTEEMSKVVLLLADRAKDLDGIFHVAAAPISKFDLLNALNSRLRDRSRTLVRFDDFKKNRSLDGSKFKERTGYQAPSWDAMLDRLAEQIREREKIA